MKRIQDIAVMLLVFACCLNWGCSSEYDEREGETELVETGTAEQGLNWPNGSNFRTDNYVIRFLSTRNDIVRTSLKDFTVGAFNNLVASQAGAPPGAPRLLVNEIPDFVAGTKTDIEVIQSDIPIGAGFGQWNIPEWLAMYQFDTTTVIPDTGGKVYRSKVQLQINTNATASKVAISGVPQDILFKAAFCRAMRAAVGGQVSNSCASSASGDSWKTFSSTWNSSLQALPLSEMNLTRQQMLDYDNFHSPDAFYGHPEL